MEQKYLYTIIYPFMSSTLGLTGIVKETFAIIFNFWIAAGESPVRASLSTMQMITGATRATIVKAVSHLAQIGLIEKKKVPGKPTLYEVLIDAEILNSFKQQYNTMVVKKKYQQWYNSHTTTSIVPKPQKIKKGNLNNSKDNLTVKTASEIRICRLSEVK